MGIRICLCLTLALATCGIVLIPSRANAQQASGYGYAFAGPAAANIGLHSVAGNAGGGGDLWLGGGISFGGESGSWGFRLSNSVTSCCRASARSATAKLVSVNASRHFVRSDSETKWRPFITGGLSVVASGEAFGLFNAGGGAERWISPTRGHPPGNSRSVPACSEPLGDAGVPSRRSLPLTKRRTGHGPAL